MKIRIVMDFLAAHIFAIRTANKDHSRIILSELLCQFKRRDLQF